MSEIATVEEVQIFCNKVRAAGGAKAIKDLMPSTPGDASSCLIAKNLNFDCRVGGYYGDLKDSKGRRLAERPDTWCMHLDSVELAEQIGTALKLRVDGRRIILPKKITQVAIGFDLVADVFSGTRKTLVPGKLKGELIYKKKLIEHKLTPNDVKRIKRYWPYIKADIKAHWVKPSFV